MGNQEVLLDNASREICSLDEVEVDDICSIHSDDTCGDGCSFVPTTCRPSYRGGFGLR